MNSEERLSLNIGEKVLHHELLAAQAEQNRRILQEELLRKQQDFREVHQQDLMKMKELQKFQILPSMSSPSRSSSRIRKIIMEFIWKTSRTSESSKLHE